MELIVLRIFAFTGFIFTIGMSIEIYCDMFRYQSPSFLEYILWLTFSTIIITLGIALVVLSFQAIIP